MVKKLNISYDSDLIESISADFDLRTPNKKALRELIFTLDGDYDTNIMQGACLSKVLQECGEKISERTTQAFQNAERFKQSQ